MAKLKNSTINKRNAKYNPIYISTLLILETKLDLNKYVNLKKNKINFENSYFYNSKNEKIMFKDIKPKIKDFYLEYGGMRVDIYKSKSSYLYYVNYELTTGKSITYGFTKFINFLKKLFKNKRLKVHHFTKIDFDIGIEAGSDLGCVPTFTVPSKLVSKLKEFNASVSITVYPFSDAR